MTDKGKDAIMKSISTMASLEVLEINLNAKMNYPWPASIASLNFKNQKFMKELNYSNSFILITEAEQHLIERRDKLVEFYLQRDYFEQNEQES